MPDRNLTRMLATSAVVLLVLAACALAGVSPATAQPPRNIIILLADGAAPTQWDFGRYSSQVLRQQPFATTDVVFRQGAMGLLTTSPHGVYVTDSAAAGSAMATGFKVANGSVSITPEGKSPRSRESLARVRRRSASRRAVSRGRAMPASCIAKAAPPTVVSVAT